MARKLTGKVVSNKMQNTVVVAVEALKTHPIYRKQYKTTARFQAHDETGVIELGSIVEIEETRPISRMKRFKVVKVVDSDKKVVKTQKTTKQESAK